PPRRSSDLEPLVREAQLYAGVRASALAPQPFAIQEVGTREIYCDAGPTEPVDRLDVQVLRRRPLGEECLGAGWDAQDPVGAACPSDRPELPTGVRGHLGRSRPDRRL